MRRNHVRQLRANEPPKNHVPIADGHDRGDGEIQKTGDEVRVRDGPKTPGGQILIFRLLRLPQALGQLHSALLVNDKIVPESYRIQ